MVRQFWQMVTNTINNYQPGFILGRKEALFGDVKSLGVSPVNTILILSRYFIWQQKFTTKALDDVHYINFMNGKLNLVYQCQKLKNIELNSIKDWRLFLSHFDVLI